MINFIKQHVALASFRRQLRKQHCADPVFLRSARESFVAMVCQRGEGTLTIGRSSVSRYAMFAIVAAISMTSGLAVFASANDVPPDHPLYEFKRLGENFHLAVSSRGQKLELHRLYAHRRSWEIGILNAAIFSVQASVSYYPAGKPDLHQVRLERLNNDFRQEAELTVDESEKFETHKEKRLQVCAEILADADLAANSSSDPFVLRIKDRCSKIGQEN